MRPRILAEVSGIRARSVNYDCYRLEAALSQGRRISITHPVVEEGDLGSRTAHHLVRATILFGRKDGKFTCVVDGGQHEGIVGKHRFRRWMAAHRIVEFLDEPRRIICQNGRVVTGEFCDRPPDEECWCEVNERLVGMAHAADRP